MESKIKHLEMIQAIIKRMASNSFLLKGWTITLVSAIFALSAKDSNQKFFIVTYIPIIVFWILDAYYLQQERKYRSLYDKVRNLTEKEIDFSMKVSNELFVGKSNYFRCLFSISECIFYLPTLVLIVIVIGCI
ncbi:hypothetical protein [Clostridium butyricum]|uniref:Uncharacterized protein n=1 Tax=Clostridium butyricum E4 str. BoNT E BL5262 TaxID=632245 RepID=C4IHB0_CLOBU|nr:hypothetical protein [Clostridium butyricum]EDT75428.1 conserved hypothetical protein [Clostridium butyricum 5521]EEP55017.1 conserved hypothetical protein [Clostridium butyricum E4 str. BoNT E BL5262]NFL30252.1 hypothetical protein [Clostridium butyricum]NFS17646.1 hypothetical protein [Clostridium butyricum]